MTRWVAIDGGQSAVRVRLSDMPQTFIGPGYAHGAGRVDELIGAVRSAINTTQLENYDLVAVGHTGLPTDDSELETIARAVAVMFGASEARLAPDMVTAHAGALGGEAGVVVSAGTGTVCLGIGRDGKITTIDGWGFLFGDSGSSFAIGRRAIELAMRHLDGRVVAPALFDDAREFFGDDLRTATWNLYASESMVDQVARFAPSVLATARAGDEHAKEIVANAVRELALTAATACSALREPGPAVSYTGGLFAAGEQITVPFRNHLVNLAPDARILAPVGDPLAGAIRLTSAQLGIHSQLVHIFRDIL